MKEATRNTPASAAKQPSSGAANGGTPTTSASASPITTRGGGGGGGGGGSGQQGLHPTDFPLSLDFFSRVVILTQKLRMQKCRNKRRKRKTVGRYPSSPQMVDGPPPDVMVASTSSMGGQNQNEMNSSILKVSGPSVHQRAQSLQQAVGQVRNTEDYEYHGPVILHHFVSTIATLIGDYHRSNNFLLGCLKVPHNTHIDLYMATPNCIISAD